MLFSSYIIALAPLSLGMLVGWLSGSGARSQWYQRLRKPSWNPPAVVFAPVWSVLYLIMGVASVPVYEAWRAGAAGSAGAGVALAVYAASLAANLAWTPTFFAWRRPDVALGVIAILLPLIGATIVMFMRYTRLWVLLLPYAAWTAFATVLNAWIVQENL